MALVAVDFDGTLFGYDEHGDPYPKNGARDSMLRLQEAGHYLVIYSARPGIARRNGGELAVEEELHWMNALLKEHKIPFDEIYAGDKFIADFYIDDRAIEYTGDWHGSVDKLLERPLKGPRHE